MPGTVYANAPNGPPASCQRVLSLSSSLPVGKWGNGSIDPPGLLQRLYNQARVQHRSTSSQILFSPFSI